VHPSLEGLRLSANYTFIDAELNAVLDDGTARTIQGLRNQPEQLFNAVASYEVGRFGASLASITGAMLPSPAASKPIPRTPTIRV